MTYNDRIVEKPASRPEHELLLLCSRTQPDDVQTARIQSLAAVIDDWGYLLRFAKRHALLPLLHHQLAKHANGAVPPSTAHQLQNEFNRNAARNLLLANELLRIVECLDAEEIEMLAYKGPTLATLAYGDLSLRRFVDLDIIVRANDVTKAMMALKHLDFFAPEFTSSQLELLTRTQSAIPLVRQTGKLTVELHWALVSNHFAAVPVSEAIWSRALSVAVSGHTIKTLATEDLLLALCIHGTKHTWERLAWVCDITQILNTQSNLDWTVVVELARQAKVERMLALGLRLAADLLQTQLPFEVERLINADRTASQLVSEVTARMFSSSELAPMSLARALNFHLRARQRVIDKLRYCQLAFTPTEADLATANSARTGNFGHYLRRPLRLVRKSLRDA